MSARRARLIGLVGAAVIMSGCNGIDTRIYWAFQRMVEQPRYEPYDTSAFFSDGGAMQPPPPWTVPRSPPTIAGVPVAVIPGGDGMVDGRYVTRIPVALSLALLERGRDRFDIYCAVCHGLLGTGQSAVAENMVLRRPPSLHQPELRTTAVGRLYTVVTKGHGLMASYAAVLSPADRWAVVAYLRALQLSQSVVVDSLPEELRREVRARLDSIDVQRAGVR